jgi:asparagine synthase (glutamine-hydrolysing)
MPQKILYCPKQGLAVPLAEWFRSPLRQRRKETLGGPLLQDAGLFNLATVGTLLDRYHAGECDHSAALWARFR